MQGLTGLSPRLDVGSFMSGHLQIGFVHVIAPA